MKTYTLRIDAAPSDPETVERDRPAIGTALAELLFAEATGRPGEYMGQERVIDADHAELGEALRERASGVALFAGAGPFYVLLPGAGPDGQDVWALATDMG